MRRYVRERIAGGETVCVDRRTGTPYPDVVCTVANSSFTFVHRSDDVGRIRIRASYSRDVWHIGLGALAGGGG